MNIRQIIHKKNSFLTIPIISPANSNTASPIMYAIFCASSVCIRLVFALFQESAHGFCSVFEVAAIGIKACFVLHTVFLIGIERIKYSGFKTLHSAGRLVRYGFSQLEGFLCQFVARHYILRQAHVICFLRAEDTSCGQNIKSSCSA